MVWVDDLGSTENKLVVSGLMIRVPDSIEFDPYYDREESKEYVTVYEDYLGLCAKEIGMIMSEILNKFKLNTVVLSHDCQIKLTFDQYELHDRDEVLKEILNMIEAFPARWTWAKVHWITIPVSGAADRMAANICEALKDEYVHIGKRVGKLTRNSDGAYIFKKKFSKHNGFCLTAEQICEEYLLNHAFFRHGKGESKVTTNLSAAASWR